LFQELTRRLERTMKKLAGQDRLTEENIAEALREVRLALLEADVNFAVAKKLIAGIKEKATGQDVIGSLTPAQQVVKIVNEELTALLGGQAAQLNLDPANAQAKGITTVMVMGLQGSGKTTFCGKLATRLKKEGRKPMLVAADIYRPAAIDQLQTLAGEVGAEFFPSSADQDPVDIATAALDQARRQHVDVVIVDTAGRLHIDREMMDEIQRLHAAVQPVETLFVVDSMTGQDAANTARAFHDALPLTGVVLTKTDGDARGGAILAIREVTGCPIRYVGVGEKLDKIEAFVPEHIAKRILGMGDVVGLVEQAQDVIDQKEAEKTAERLFADRFTMVDLEFMFDQIQRVGGMKSVIDKLPGGAGLPTDQLDQIPDESKIVQWKAVISSMTPQERMDPSVLHMQRRHRIARGSGTKVGTVNEVIRAYKDMRRQMKDVKKQGLMGRVAGRALKRQKTKRLKRMKREGANIKGWFNT